jgi:hypothetical protein
MFRQSRDILREEEIGCLKKIYIKSIMEISSIANFLL